MVKPALNSLPISHAFGPSGPGFGLSPTLQAYSCLQPLNNSLAHHPQVGQRKHHQQLAGVFGQAPVTRLAMPKLTLDHPKRMLHLGADAGLELFELIRQGVADPRFVQRLAIARHHRNVPVHNSVIVLNLLSLCNTPAARVGKHNFFLSMQQGMRLRHIVCIGHRQYLHAQVVLLKHVPKAQDGAFIGQAVDAGIELGKFAVQRDVVQSFFHGRVGVPEELLQQMDAKHRLGGKRCTPRLAGRCMRSNQGQLLRPMNDRVHLVQELTLARALGDKLESGVGKAELFHMNLINARGIQLGDFCRPSLSSGKWPS